MLVPIEHQLDAIRFEDGQDTAPHIKFIVVARIGSTGPGRMVKEDNLPKLPRGFQIARQPIQHVAGTKNRAAKRAYQTSGRARRVVETIRIQGNEMNVTPIERVVA